MTKSILFAGFGGQGVLFAGKQMASTGMYLDRHVTWLPSYGPEMRGGTANCTVNISDSEIGSPIQARPDILVAMNLPSYLKFIDQVAPGGILISDSSLISEKTTRTDIQAYYIPATKIADENDFKTLANVIILGHLIAVTGIFKIEEIEAAMVKSIPASKAALIELNKKALKLGYEYKS